jgi:hypothetical protein
MPGPPRAPPRKPPTLQNPWVEERIARSAACSSSTALALVATSIMAMLAPIAAMARARVGMDGARTAAGRVTAQATAVVPTMTRDPKRAVRRPEKHMAAMAPIPMPKIRRPRVDSVMAWRGRRRGICGAQEPRMAPFRRNSAEMAMRQLRAGVGSSGMGRTCP